MKRILLSAALSLLVVIVYAQSKRTVLFEEFTQASCPPCEVNKPFINEVVGNSKDKLVQIRYQTSWPGVDPMNQDNPSEVAQRVSYYEVGGVPSVHLDGSKPQAVGNYILPQTAVDTRSQIESPILVQVSHVISADFKTMDVMVQIINESDSVFNTNSKLRVAIIEQEIRWPFRPGSTSLMEFQGVMKKFINGTAGMGVQAINPKDTLTFSFESVELPNRVYDLRELAVVAFVQNDASKEVLNAALSEPKDLEPLPDLALVSVNTTTGGLCDLAYTAKVTVSNQGNLKSEQFAIVLLSGGEVLGEIIEENGLDSNEIKTYDFAGDLLAGGNNITAVVAYSEPEYAILNNLTGSTLIGKISDAEKIDKTFEQDELGQTPKGAIVKSQFSRSNFITVNSAFINSNQATGGFGASDRSVLVNFYQWDPNTYQRDGNMVIAEKVVVKETDVLFFDYAYTTWQNSNDRLRVQVSKDCGATFTTVWDKAGSQLRTAPEVNQGNAFFKPSPTHWQKAEIPLTNFVGEEVVIRFFATSDWGDMLYLDNIVITAPNSIESIQYIQSAILSPNPAFEFTNLILNITESNDVFVKLYDMTGRMMSTDKISLGNVGYISHRIDTSSLESGLYLVEINIGTERLVKKLVITQ